jgi:hypothetical protein
VVAPASPLQRQHRQHRQHRHYSASIASIATNEPRQKGINFLSPELLPPKISIDYQ